MASSVLYVAWRDPLSRSIRPIGRLTVDSEDGDSKLYEFRYLNLARELEKNGFEPLLSFPSLDRAYRSDVLFPLFTNRLMPTTRSDYNAYIERLGLSGIPEPFIVLARNGGQRATDTLEVFALPEQDSTDAPFRTLFFARGIAYIDRADEKAATLRQGDRLFWMLDRQNEVDAGAIALRTKDLHLVGFMPSYFGEDLNLATEQADQLIITVHRVNPGPAPVQHRLLCQLEVRWPDGFRPFSGPQYQPIPELQ